MSLVFASISPTEVTRILKPSELGASIRKKYADLKAAAEEEAAQQEDLSDALKEVDGEEKTETTTEQEEEEGKNSDVNASATTEPSAAAAYTPTPEEEILMNECAFDDPAKEAERRAAIIRELVFGQDTQLASEFGDDEERTSVLVEFLLGCVHFAEESKFTDEQVSVVFGIAERLFSVARSPNSSATTTDEGKKNGEQQQQQQQQDTTTSRLKWAPRTECYASFAGMVRQHAIPDPKSNVRTFSALDVENISEFFSTTFFRHYKAYEYSFTVERRTVTDAVDVVVGSPMEMPPLSQAKEIIITEAEKRAKAEALAMEKQANQEIESKKEGKNEKEEMKGQKEETNINSKKEEILDERLLREINKRVEEETIALEAEVNALREVVEDMNDADDD